MTYKSYHGLCNSFTECGTLQCQCVAASSFFGESQSNDFLQGSPVVNIQKLWNITMFVIGKSTISTGPFPQTVRHDQVGYIPRYPYHIYGLFFRPKFQGIPIVLPGQWWIFGSPVESSQDPRIPGSTQRRQEGETPKTLIDGCVA